jgi:hypothetical protein
MRINGDLRKCVAFIGYANPDVKGGIACLGTVFFAAYDGARYIVTAQHIAMAIGDAPFVIRLNKISGGSENIQGDVIEHNLKWYSHADPNVDLAIMPFNFDLRMAGNDVLLIPEAMLAQTATVPTEAYIGDECYVIGLFRLLAGETRNLPVVHTGNIALLAGEEAIPVHDWLTTPDSGKIRHIDAYLVEAQSLRGLSGSPVFVRPPIEVGPLELKPNSVTLLSATTKLALLGVWQGSWEAGPDTVRALQHAKLVRVPVGMGVVTPIDKLREIFEMPAVKEERQKYKDRIAAANLPTPDSISRVARKTEEIDAPESDNPAHKEDFMSQLTLAAKTRPQGD